MIGEWNKAEGDEQISPVINFLAGCGEAKAIRVLTEQIDKWPVSVRMDVLFAPYERGNMFSLFPNRKTGRQSATDRSLTSKLN